MLPLLSACSRVAEDARDGLDLTPIERPADLPQLDAAVQRQFNELWQDFERAKASSKRAERADAFGKLGQFFDVYGYDESARRAYGNAALLDPNEPRWPYYLGRLAEESGDLEKAEAYFRRSAVSSPDTQTAARLRLADLSLRQMKLDLAAELYAELLAREPQNPGALLGAGRVALQRGDAEGALGPLVLLSRLQPEAVQVHYSLGLAYRRLGREAQADQEMSKIPAENLDQIAFENGAAWDRDLQLLDHGARTLTQRGVRAFRRGEYQQAAILLGRAVEAEPKGPEKRINYALALFELGYASAAVSQLETALELAESDSEMAAKAHLELGRILSLERHPAMALPHLHAALEMDPQSNQAHVELGRLLHNLGRLEEALPHYAAVRAGTKASASTRFWHDALLFVLGRRSDAIEALEEDLAKIGDDRQLRLLLARLLVGTDQVEASDLNRARKLLREPAAEPDAFFAESAAMVAAAEGRFDQAMAWQRAAIAALETIRPRQAAQRARRRLVLYQRGEACPNPWEATELPQTQPVHPPPLPKDHD